MGDLSPTLLLTEIVDEQLFENLKKEGLENADARHLMYAICNDCDRFITLDKHFLNRKSGLKPFCGKLLICKPSELVNELNL